MRWLFPFIVLLAFGCVPGPPVDDDRPEDRVRHVARTARVDYIALRSEIYKEAAHKMRTGGPEREIAEWMREAEVAAAKAANQPLNELQLEYFDGASREDKARFLETVSEEFKP